MNRIVRLLVRVPIMAGITNGIVYFATRVTDAETPEGKAAAKSGRQSANNATRMIHILRRFTRF